MVRHDVVLGTASPSLLLRQSCGPSTGEQAEKIEMASTEMASKMLLASSKTKMRAWPHVYAERALGLRTPFHGCMCAYRRHNSNAARQKDVQRRHSSVKSSRLELARHVSARNGCAPMSSLSRNTARTGALAYSRPRSRSYGCLGAGVVRGQAGPALSCQEIAAAGVGPKRTRPAGEHHDEVVPFATVGSKTPKIAPTVAQHSGAPGGSAGEHSTLTSKR